jgi:hypothetical protein
MREAEFTQEETPPVEVVARVDLLAKEAGMLPEMVGVGGKRVGVNPKHWLYRAICLRMTWNEHTLVTQEAFNTAVETVSEFTLR